MHCILEVIPGIVNAGWIGLTRAGMASWGRSLSGGLVMIVRLRPLSRQEVRGLDEQAAAELAMPGLLLMENAGRGAAGWLAELSARSRRTRAGGRSRRRPR